MNLSLSEHSVTVETHGAQYHVEISGQGNPVMLLHGFTGSSKSWGYVHTEMGERFTVIRPDLLGHGQTSAPDNPQRYSILQAAADLIAILDRLNIPRVGLHGYSMGGRLALYTALAFPERIAALSLESTSPGIADDNDRAARHHSDNVLADKIMQGGVAAFIDVWEKLPLFSTQSCLPLAVRTHQRTLRLNNRAIGLANSLRGMGTGTQPSLWERLSELEMPALLMSGRKDTKFDLIADQMAQKIPVSARIGIRNCGHTIHLECRENWQVALTMFFDGIVPFW